MVQTLLANIANIHSRALAHGLQAFKHLDITRGIILFLIQLFFCHFFNVLQFFGKGTKKKSDKLCLSAKKLQKNTAAL
jgi:hypothetical protein